MFTGLIEAVGQVVERAATAGGGRVRIQAALTRELSVGDSVAVNGACLTATRINGSEFVADVGPETLRITTIGRLGPGAVVNLERPLRTDARLGGHFVQGHVDGVGRIEQMRADAEFEWITIGFPPSLAPSIVEKGSIAVDGISLTVAHLASGSFDVQIVPYTLDHTNLKGARVGDPVNLETDIIGKYAVRAAELLLAARSGADRARG